MADNKRIIYTIEVDDKGSVKIKELGQQVDSLSDAFVLLNNNMLKILVNSILKVYPAKRPFNISSNYEEAMRFVKEVTSKN